MANYHVLRSSEDGKFIEVAMHFPVPVETNQAGKNLSLAIVEDTSVDKVSVVSDVSTDEQNDLSSGVLWEEIISFRTHKDVPDATKIQRIKDLYNDLLPTVQEELREQYTGWGLSGSASVV